MTTPSNAPVPAVRLDRLSALLEGLAPEVTVRHLSAASAFTPLTGPMPTLRLYLLIGGRASLQQDGQHKELASPSLVICSAVLRHRLMPQDGPIPASIVLVEACLRGPAASLLLDAFDAPLVIPLVDAEASLLHTVGLIAAELEQPRCGQPALLHRAGDILFIGVLRHVVARPVSTVGGILSGLADPRLARALVAIHTRPQAHWTLELLAAEAGMSRTAFAKHFHTVMRLPPGRYLQVVRLAIARSEVIAGKGLKRAAQAAGYQSAAALSRALSRPPARKHHAQRMAIVQ